jgi:AcrR family transcriptional regulator
MTQLSPKEKRHQRTHQAILDAARQIVHEKGIDGLSMRAIAERIEYSPAGLYEYFGSKEEIIGAICLQGHRRLRAYMERVDLTLPIAEYLIQIGLAYIEFATQNPDFFLLMFTLTSAEVANVADLTHDDDNGMMSKDSAFALLVAAIKRGVTAGIFQTRPGFDVMGMAFAAWAVVHGMAMLRVTNLRSFTTDWEQISRETLRAFGRGLMGQ